MSKRIARTSLALLVIVFLGLGAAYALATPCFESPDESSHLTVVRFLSRHRTLPPLVRVPRHHPTPADVAWYLSYHDPPLYYAPPLYYGIAAALTSWASMDDLPYLLVPSPIWEVGWAPQADHEPVHKNMYAHRAEETLTESSTVRAAYLLRLLSLGLGAVTVLCTYGIARLLWTDRPALALGAAAFVALNPQFIAISAGVTNDNLLTSIFSLFLLGALRHMHQSSPWHRWAMLGGLAGLGLLTKQTALLLLPLGCLAIAMQPRDTLSWRKLLVDGGGFLAAAASLGGWWYVRNAILYRDPLGMGSHLAHRTPLAGFGLQEAWMTARSYWAAFGWALILAESPIYAVIGLVMLMALAGLAVSVLRGGALRKAPRLAQCGTLFLAAVCVLNVISFVQWAVTTGAPYGRLLFPSIAAAGVLVAWGLAQWTRWRVARWTAGALVGLASVFAALVPWLYLRPAFSHPYLPDGMPEAAQPVDTSSQGDILLVGYQATTDDLKPGRRLDLTLYWRSTKAPGQRYGVFVQLGLRDPTDKVAEYTGWVGGTLYPSELWRAGDVVRQTYSLSIPIESPAPALTWLRIGLLDAMAVRGDTATLGPWRMQADTPPAPPECAADYGLGADIRLVGYELVHEPGAQSVAVTLHWLAGSAPAGDHTVFVHLVDGDHRVLGQNDSPPRDGSYPTSWWLPGEVILDRHTIPLNEALTGSAQLRVGMYDPATMVRSPAFDGAGQRLLDDIILLTEISPGMPACGAR